MKFPQGENSVVIHHTKNYLLYKDATCHNLWPCDFTDVTAFSFLFFLALHYCFFLCMFYLLWVFSLIFFFMVVMFFFKGTFLPWLLLFLAVSLASSAQFFCLFLWPFCPILLGGCLLALRRASISSNWFFIWHSLRPSSTQLLVNNHSGFCSHWYLVGLLFLLSTSFYRLCFSLPPYFSFKWFSSL